MLVASSSRVFFYVSPFAGFFLRQVSLAGIFLGVVTPLPVISKAPYKRIQHCWLTTPNIVGCYILRPFAHPVACCWMLLRVVAQSLKPVKLFSQQLPTFLLLRDRRSVAQQCWIRLHSSSNIVGATHAHYAWFTKTYGLYPSHDALHVPTLLGVVASVCTPFPTTPNNVGATMLGVVASVCTQPNGPSLRTDKISFS